MYFRSFHETVPAKNSMKIARGGGGGVELAMFIFQMLLPRYTFSVADPGNLVRG